MPSTDSPPSGRDSAATSGLIPTELVVGVDGGGSKTIAWLAHRDAPLEAEPVGIGEAGPGNPRAAGFEVARSNIAVAIERAWAAAGRSATTAASACLGLSGAGRSEEQHIIRDWALQSRLATQVKVTHDAEIILSAASTRPAGVALICGTGSFAWGRTATGTSGRSGGWGYLLGDEGSGYAIALAGLRAIALAADGRGPSTVLEERLCQALGIGGSDELITRIYQPHVHRESIAALATIVCDASDGDDVAGRIVDDAAAELAGLIAALTRRLPLRSGDYDLALAGGVISHQPKLQRRLLSELERTQVAPARTVVVADPVRGAVALARRLR